MYLSDSILCWYATKPVANNAQMTTIIIPMKIRILKPMA